MKTSLLVVLTMASSISFAHPNPSSLFCGEVGGTQKPGMEGCYFGLESGIGAWTLWRHFHEKNEKQMAVEAYFGRLKKTTPAGPTLEQSCNSFGGKFKLERPTDGGIAQPICEFSDGSEIDADTLKNGPEHAKNSKLTKLLSSRVPPTKSSKPKEVEGADASA